MLLRARPVGGLPAAYLAALALAPAAPGSAPRDRAQPPPQAIRAPVERALSELVLIETYVTDAHGRPITGLTAGDFVLFVDGHKSPIASFELHEVARPRSGEAPAAAEESPGAALQAPASPRRFMLFFEDGTSAPQGLTEARRAADRFLATGLVPSDLVGLAAYDTRLRILHDFTLDREALRRTLDESLNGARRVSDFASESRRRSDEIRSLLAEAVQMGVHPMLPQKEDPHPELKASRTRTRTGNPVPSDALVLVDQAKLLVTAYASEEAPRLRGVLEATRSLVDALAAWRGYKAIVFMGDGIPENPAQPYVELILDQFQDDQIVFRTQPLSLSSDLLRLAQAAAAAGVTIHTLQTRGLEAGTATELRASSRRQDSLGAIALATGGLSSSSNDFLGVLNAFEAGSRTFYILGYQPEGPPDGMPHTVQVRCRKSGAQVRWRKGFLRLKPEEARARTNQAAHLLPELQSQLPIALAAIAGPGGEASRVADLVVHLPRDSILFLPEGGRPTAHLEVGLVALEDGGRQTLRTSRRLRVALRPEQGRAGDLGINLVTRVTLPAAAQTITAVVYDDTGGTVGAARLSLASFVPGAGRILGLSVYSLEEKSLWIEVPEGRTEDAAAGPDAEPRIGPALKGSFAPGERLVCGFRTAAARGSDSAPLRVVIRQGDRIMTAVEVGTEGAGAGDAIQVPLPAEGLPAGEYVVAVQEVLPDGAVDRGTAPLIIRTAGAPAAAAGAPPAR